VVSVNGFSVLAQTIQLIMMAIVQPLQDLLKAVQTNVIQMICVMPQRNVAFMDVQLEESVLALYHKDVLQQISEE
jgi:hypothetical protein